MKNNKKGFTLIELLIVVAIIAILAAIAIPNFLQAQVRAKVSRARAELTTLSTALESYMVDENLYPDDIDPTGWPWYMNSAISSPVAYISSGLIEDVFRKGVPTAIPGTPGIRYRYMNYNAEISGHYSTQAEAWFPHPGATATVSNGQRKYGAWRLTSAGPDRGASYEANFYDDIAIYDPTNGTISRGDLIRGQVGVVVSDQ